VFVGSLFYAFTTSSQKVWYEHSDTHVYWVAYGLHSEGWFSS